MDKEGLRTSWRSIEVKGRGKPQLESSILSLRISPTTRFPSWTSSSVTEIGCGCVRFSLHWKVAPVRRVVRKGTCKRELKGVRSLFEKGNDQNQREKKKTESAFLSGGSAEVVIILSLFRRRNYLFRRRKELGTGQWESRILNEKKEAGRLSYELSCSSY